MNCVSFKLSCVFLAEVLLVMKTKKPSRRCAMYVYFADAYSCTVATLRASEIITRCVKTGSSLVRKCTSLNYKWWESARVLNESYHPWLWSDVRAVLCFDSVSLGRKRAYSRKCTRDWKTRAEHLHWLIIRTLWKKISERAVKIQRENWESGIKHALVKERVIWLKRTRILSLKELLLWLTGRALSGRSACPGQKDRVLWWERAHALVGKCVLCVVQNRKRMCFVNKERVISSSILYIPVGSQSMGRQTSTLQRTHGSLLMFLAPSQE